MAEPPIVQQAEQVNIDTDAGHELPHRVVIMLVTFIVLGGFGVVTWAVLASEVGNGVDAATKGALIQTWNNLGVMAAGFWLGSSLGGKMTKKGSDK